MGDLQLFSKRNHVHFQFLLGCFRLQPFQPAGGWLAGIELFSVILHAFPAKSVFCLISGARILPDFNRPISKAVNPLFPRLRFPRKFPSQDLFLYSRRVNCRHDLFQFLSSFCIVSKQRIFRIDFQIRMCLSEFAKKFRARVKTHLNFE